MLYFNMIFFHILADYALQSLCNHHNMKQRSWWEDQLEEDLDDTIYKNDYKIALQEHAFSWAFCINIPIAANAYYHNIYDELPITLFMIMSIFINAFIHYIVDDRKANDKTINLKQDQMYHLVQIIVTCILYLVLRAVLYGVRV